MPLHYSSTCHRWNSNVYLFRSSVQLASFSGLTWSDNSIKHHFERFSGILMCRKFGHGIPNTRGEISTLSTLQIIHCKANIRTQSVRVRSKMQRRSPYGLVRPCFHNLPKTGVDIRDAVAPMSGFQVTEFRAVKASAYKPCNVALGIGDDHLRSLRAKSNSAL